jgi:hypothetical protein
MRLRSPNQQSEREIAMELRVREALADITTGQDTVKAFQDEDHCWCLLEAMVWPNGRICLACGYRRSIALAGRESGKRARPRLYRRDAHAKEIRSSRPYGPALPF